MATFRDQVTRVKDTDNVPMTLVGNKCDIEDQREVEKDEAMAFAKEIGCLFSEASAKTSLNVEKPFFDVARKIKAAQNEGGQEDANPVKKKKSKCLIL